VVEMNLVPLKDLHKVFRHLSVDFHTPEMLNGMMVYPAFHAAGG
jgi:hypothetical protein